MLYCHSNKIVTGPGNSLKSQHCVKNVRNVTKFILIVFRIQKKISVTSIMYQCLWWHHRFFLKKKTRKKTIVYQGLLHAKKCYSIQKTTKSKKKLLRKNRSPPGKCFPQNVISLPMRAKIVISPKAAEKYVTPAYRMWGGGRGRGH